MTRSLHPNPSLENLKKQAKALKKAWQAHDAAAVERIRSVHPKFTAAQPRLSDCQLVLAREAGFDSWPQLRIAVESAKKDLPEQFLNLACLCYGDPHYDYRSFHAQARTLLHANPWLASADIWSAATSGNAASVHAFLEENPDLLNRPGPYGWTPLFCACYSRVRPTLQVAQLLLERGANPNTAVTKNYYGEFRFTALTGVFGGGDTGMANQPAHPQWLDLAELLLKQGASPVDAMTVRINQGPDLTFRKLELLLQHGLKADSRVNADSPTVMGIALTRAIYMRDPKSVKLLLAHHAKTDEQTNGKTPWALAMECGALTIARLLAEAGAPTAELSDAERFVSLCLAGDAENARKMLALVAEPPEDLVHRAVNTGKKEVVELALDLGFDPNFQDESAAIHTAGVLAEHPEIVGLLLARGADLTLREPFYDSTAIGWAHFFDHLELRDTLLNEPGICLFDALEYDRLDRVPAVLARDPASLERPFAKCLTREPKPQDWQTPLVRMVERGNAEAVRVLLQHGAAKTARHPSGLSLLELARDKGLNEIAALLPAG